MASYPKDIFDDLPEDLVRVGAHRAPKKRGGGWIGLAWAALATGVLVVGGLYGLSLINPDVSFEIPGVAVDEPEETPTPTATPTAEPITDPTLIDPARGISITVLNGTATPGLQNTAGDSLAALAWPVGSRAPATASDIETTYIYYSDPLNEDVARGVALALGIGEVRESTAFLGAPITVVLGADYVPTP